jgi:uncharacterized membrane protein YjdF
MHIPYLFAITLGLVVTYLVLLNFLPTFFGKPRHGIHWGSYKSMIGIMLLSFVGYWITTHIDDSELANRFLHAYGGGFVAFFMCFCAVRDAHRGISRLQLATFAFLMVGMLGIINEIAEYILHAYGHLVFVEDIFDTSLDLIANTVGSIVALVLLTPLHNRKFLNG